MNKKQTFNSFHQGNRALYAKHCNISYPSVLTFVLGAKNNRLIGMVLLSTHIICFGWEIRKINFEYALEYKSLYMGL